MSRSRTDPDYIAFAAPFALACCFPYLPTSPLPSDVQPHAFLLAAFLAPLLLLIRADLPWPFALLGAVVLTAIAATVADPSMTALRRLVGYLTLTAVSVAFFIFARAGLAPRTGLLKAVALIWLLGGLAQLAAGKEILAPFVSEIRGSAQRGMTSFAPEPGFYATTMMFLATLFLMRGRRGWALACGATVPLVAQSPMVSMVAAASLTAFAVRRWPLRWVALSALVIAATLAFPFVVELDEATRIGRVFGIVMDRPQMLFLIDASANQRAGEIVFSLMGALDALFLPRGLSDWPVWAEEAARRWAGVFWYFDPGQAPGSAYGAALFELGFVGLLLPVLVHLSLSGIPDPADRLAARVTMHLLLVTAISFATPLIGMVVGLGLAQLYVERPAVRPIPVRVVHPAAREMAQAAE